MRRISFLAILMVTCCFFSCDKDYFSLEMNHKKIITFQFLNQTGMNIASDIDFKWETIQVNEQEREVLSPDEYTLKLFVNGEEKTAELVFNDKSYTFPDKPRYSFIFSYPEGEGGNLEKKKNYTFEYLFSCPKLFGDKQTRSIRVEAPWKDGYHPVTGVFLDGQPLTEKWNDTILDVVLH